MKIKCNVSRETSKRRFFVVQMVGVMLSVSVVEVHNAAKR